MLKIGITGGIGSGKSLVCQIFSELGVPVYHADIEARRIMESDTEVISEIKKLFGNSAYSREKLNRNNIGKIVFNDEKKLRSLNAVVHPAVRRDFNEWAKQYHDFNYVIEEAAILFESGGAKEMDYVIFVKAEMELRVKRVMLRDNVDRDSVMQRIHKQMDEIEKEKLADFIIYNENDSMILPQILDLHNNLSKTKN